MYTDSELKILRDALEIPPSSNWRECLYSKAKSLGIKRSKGATKIALQKSHQIYKINNSLIKDNEITSFEIATLFGFTMADGYVNDNRNSVTWHINKQDLEYLKKIKTILEYTGKIYFHPSNNGAPSLDIINKNLYGFFIKNGCYQNKSLTLEYPKQLIGHRYEMSFVRGFMEGDGGVNYVLRKKSNKSFINRIRFIGTGEMMTGIEGFFRKNIINNGETVLDKRNLYKDKRHENIYTLEYSGKKSFAAICYWLYKDVVEGQNRLYMQRKLDTFRHFHDNTNGEFCPPELKKSYEQW